MILGVSGAEFAWLVAAILAGGVVSGILAGLFGIGGGGIMVPVFYEVFRVLGVPDEVRMQLCVGTSLAVIIPTSLRAFRAHRQRGPLPLGILKIWAVPMVVGIAVGGVIAGLAPAWVFKLIFVVVASLLAARLLFGREHWRLGDEMPGRGLMTVYGFMIGLYSSLMGLGGGSVATLIMTLYGISIHVAVALSAGIGVLISIFGTLAYMAAGLPQQALLPPFSVGFVSLLGLVLMAPVSTLVAPYGARLAHALSKRTLEIAFGCFLALVALRFLASLVF
jgi:uncharacterized membrane protein YfcA